MVDGVSILGTAVGVTSLGIQVCQALVRYYLDFRGFSEDIAAVITRAEGLEASLEALESIRPAIEVANSHVSIQLQQAIETCSKGLTALKAMVEKCGEVEIPISAQEKRRFLKKKILYPFREETLRELRNKLDELQANVILALQILDIDTGRRHFDIIRSSTDALVIRSNKLENSILEQSKSLSSAQEYLQHIASGQEQEISQISQLSLQLASIEDQLKSLIARDAPPKPTSLSLTDEQHDQRVHQPLAMKLERQTYRRWCTCRVRKDVICWKKLGDSFEIKTVQETEHRPSCNFFRHGNWSYTLQGQFSHYTKLFGLCIQASIAICKVSGWTSIRPGFSVRRLVHINSPAFAAFFHVRCLLKCHCGNPLWTLYCECGSPKVAPLILDSILSSVRHSIEEGRASQYDTLMNGHNILHMAFKLVLNMINWGHIDTHVAWNFLRCFIPCGIFDHATNDANTFVDELLSHDLTPDRKQLEKVVYVSSLLISESESWSYDPYSLHPDFDSLMQKLLSYEHVLERYDCQCPLVFAIQSKSKNNLIRELNIHGSVMRSGNRTCSKTDPCQKASKLILASANWPKGLRILLSSFLVKGENKVSAWDSLDYDDFNSVVCYAVMNSNLESLDLLAHFGWPVYPTAWFFMGWFATETIPAFSARLLSAMLNWKVHRLDTSMGRRPLLDCEMASGFFNLSTQAIWNHDLDNLYHAPDLSVTLANTLWEAGFKEVDNLGSSFTWACDVPCTPLWIKSRLYSPNYDLMEWFVEKGAKLDWVEPILHTTPAHCIGLRLAENAHIFKFRERFKDEASGERFLAKVLAMEHLDECFCHCSTGGCLAIGCAAKLLEDSLLHSATLPTGTRLVLDTIAKAIDSTHHQSNSLGLAVIRVLTFNELSLTHTCCMPDFRPEKGYQDEEFCDIHAMEEKDIKILEDLMTEFKQSWNEHQGTFQEYLEGTWKVQMGEAVGVDEESTEYIKCVERVGVTLWQPFGPKNSPSESLRSKNNGLCDSIFDEDGRLWRRNCCLED